MAYLAHGGPPILPMYKSHVRKRAPQQTLFNTIPIMIFLLGFLGFFFCSIYIGASYLHEHLQDEKWGNKIGLPGTRNVIQKWSLKHLGGIDLTALGPPAKKNATVTHHFRPFKFMFESPFAKQTSITTEIASDANIPASGLVNKLEKMISDAVPSLGHEDKVDQLVESFKRMMHKNEIPVHINEEKADEDHGSEAQKIVDNLGAAIISTDVDKAVVRSAQIKQNIGFVSELPSLEEISDVEVKPAAISEILEDKTSDLADKMKKMISDVGPLTEDPIDEIAENFKNMVEKSAAVINNTDSSPNVAESIVVAR